MIFENRQNDEEKARKFVLDALIRHHRGDTQHIHSNISEFLDSPAGKAMREKYAELQQEVHEVWKMAGFEQSEIQQTKELEKLDGEAEILRNAGEDETEKVIAEEAFADDNKSDVEIEELTQTAEVEADVILIDMEPAASNEDIENMHEAESESEMNYQARIHLANGKAKTAYHFDLHKALAGLELASLLSVEENGLEAAGLQLNADSLAITGFPQAAGQFPVSFTFHFEAGHIREFQTNLDILPDPRALWQSLEPEAGLPYAKPHEDAAHLRGPDRNLLAASVRGRSHAHKAGFRDDDFAIDYQAENGWYLIAVADGAGSATYARKGAAIACEVALETLRSADLAAFEADLLPHLAAYQTAPSEQSERQVRRSAYAPLCGAAFAAFRAIQAEAETMQAPLRQFHTTLILTMAHKFEFGWFIATWWVGDGGMGIYRAGESIEVLGTPDGGEFAGQTRFLTMPDIWRDDETIFSRVHFHLTDDFTAIMLMTDGITDPKIETDYNLGQVPIWDKLWEDLSGEIDFSPENEQALEQLRSWLQFWSPGDHDDRTIAILY